MPNIDHILESLTGARVFSALDLNSGYHQISLAEDDRYKTAFTCEFGLFEYNVKPFGVTNGPATFQRLMDQVLKGLLGKICYVYLDDIIIFSPDFDTHEINLRQVLDRLEKAGLTANISKCKLGLTSITFLGHIVSEHGLATDPEKVKSVVEYPTPTNVKAIERFIGMATWYHKFIPKFSQIAAPLNALHRKDAKWEWSAETDQAFQNLKQSLVESPILAYPDLSKPFTVQCDASNVQ